MIQALYVDKKFSTGFGWIRFRAIVVPESSSSQCSIALTLLRLLTRFLIFMLSHDTKFLQ
jgi:hypothetical protein